MMGAAGSPRQAADSLTSLTAGSMCPSTSIVGSRAALRPPWSSHQGQPLCQQHPHRMSQACPRSAPQTWMCSGQARWRRQRPCPTMRTAMWTSRVGTSLWRRLRRRPWNLGSLSLRARQHPTQVRAAQGQSLPGQPSPWGALASPPRALVLGQPRCPALPPQAPQ